MSTIRLWDNEFKFLISQNDCPIPKRGPITFEVAIAGDGPIRQFVKEAMNNSLDMYLTVDLNDTEYATRWPWSRRIGGKVLKFEIEERRCECRENRIITTTITAAS